MSDQLRHPDLDRLLDLLADQATGALDSAGQAELESLLHRLPPMTDEEGRPVSPDAMHRAAGVLASASVEPVQLSASFRERLVKQGEALVASTGSASTAAGRARMGWLGWTGWAAAAALAVALLMPRGAQSPAQRLALVQSESGTQTVGWTVPAGADPVAQGVSGDVVWNNRTQRGFLRFKGLAQNDPSKEQYQLWIFDSGRNDPEPIDGGVFDITQAERDAATGDYLVPINAKLMVRQPAAFAVTVEKPGGVVVTKKERLVVLAPVPKA